MSTKLLTIFSCDGPLCEGELPAKVVVCVQPEKVAPKVCPEQETNQPFQFTYIEGELVYQCLKTCGDTSQWEFQISYDDVQLAENQKLRGGDVRGLACKGCLGQYADERAGGEVYVITPEEGPQVLVSQHGCEYELVGVAGPPGPPGPPGPGGGVDSFNGRTGAVVSQANDYTWNQIDKTVSNIADITIRSHTSLTLIGTNTHAQIDSHIASTSNPHAVTKTQVGLGNVTDDAQLKRAANDFTTFTNKPSPVAADIVLIEDSAAGFAKKKVSITALSGTAPVQSVFGRTGNVVAQANDYTWAQINKTVSDIADITTRDHASLTSIGVNTHAQIDTHIASTANPHAVTKTQVGLGNVTDDAQLKRAAGDFSTFATKAIPVAADVLLIEDSAAAGAKKYITAGNLPREYSEQSDTADNSTTSTTYVVISGMTVTPAAGTYKASFSGSAGHSNNGVLANYAIHVNAVAIAHSERDFETAGGSDMAVYTQAVVTVTGVEAVDVRFKTAANTFTIHERSLILEKLTA